jgi:hypothetical protein
MALYLTNENVLEINYVAINRVAKCLNIQNTELKSWLELYNDISTTGDSIFELLDNFIVNYRQWHNFHVLLEHDNNNGNLDWIKADILTKLIYQRDHTRNLLIQELHERGH